MESERHPPAPFALRSVRKGANENGLVAGIPNRSHLLVQVGQVPTMRCGNGTPRPPRMPR